MLSPEAVSQILPFPDDGGESDIGKLKFYVCDLCAAKMEEATEAELRAIREYVAPLPIGYKPTATDAAETEEDDEDDEATASGDGVSSLQEAYMIFILGRRRR